MSKPIYHIRVTVEYFDKDGNLISSEAPEGRGLFCLVFKGYNPMTDQYTLAHKIGRNVTSLDVASAIMSDEDTMAIAHDCMANYLRMHRGKENSNG